VNEKIMKQAGFGKEVTRVSEGRCPFCNRKVSESDLRDSVSRKEFKISGLCQSCQDKTFG
jgi:hypothetical protein